MQAGELVTSDAEAFGSVVLVNGVEREFTSWSVNRGLVGDLPAQVVGGGGIKQATGTIVWPAGLDVTERAANPWNTGSGWLPKAGDRVEIWAGDSNTYWKVFTGVVDDTTGTVGGTPESSIIDDYDRLNVRFSHDALLRVMPPLANGGVRRGVGLSPLYILDAALRRAGFCATPPKEPRAAVSIPAQGSMWPEAGGVEQASDLTGGLSHAQFVGAPWGQAASDFQCRYAPAVQLNASNPVELTVMVAPDHRGNGSLNVFYGSGQIQLAVAGSRTVIARANGADVCSLVMGPATVVSLLVKNNTWTLKTNEGVTATGNATLTGATGVMSGVTLTGDANTRMAGFQVCYPSTTTEFRPVNYTPTAQFSLSGTGFISLMDACPAIPPTLVSDIVKQIGDATLTAMWIDETGKFRAVPSDSLQAQTSIQTVSTQDDIRSLSWQDSLLSVRSGVDVDYRQPVINLSTWENILFHQGSGVTLESGQTGDDIISSPADEDWIQPDLVIETFGTSGTAAASNSGRGSMTGAVRTDGTTEWLADSNYLTATLSQIVPGTLKITHTAGTLPAGQRLELRYPSASSTIWPRWLKSPFPLIRGFAKVAWADATRTSAITGPSFAPVLVHDAGPWLSRTDNTIVIERLADFLATQVSSPKPTITGMRVGFDPRRQLGDVITISSPNLLGITLTALIVDLQNKADGSYTQTVGVRIIRTKTAYTTYEQFESAHPNTLTYEQWHALLPATETYAQFNNEPLKGAVSL